MSMTAPDNDVAVPAASHILQAYLAEASRTIRTSCAFRQAVCGDLTFESLFHRDCGRFHASCLVK